MTARKAATRTPARKAAKKSAPAPAEKRKPGRKAKAREVPPALVVPLEPGDWPSDLDNATAEKLFEAIEDLGTVKKAADSLGLRAATVYQWKRRHPRFADRLEEAVDVGIELHIDEGVEIADTACDRDTAAAVKERLGAREAYRRARRPERYHINPFKGGGPGGGDQVLGIVLVPMKASQLEQQPERPVIEGSVVRVPAKATS